MAQVHNSLDWLIVYPSTAPATRIPGVWEKLLDGAGSVTPFLGHSLSG